MMRLRQRTMDAIAAALAQEAFAESIIPHLQHFSPRHASMLGERGLRDVVELGIERARPYGLTNPGVLRFYVELMFLYGSFFDTDPLFPWAAQALGDGSLADPGARASNLHDQMSWYYDTVSGPDLASDRDALRAATQVRAGDALPGTRDFEEDLMAKLAALHPARASYIGEGRLRTLVRAAVAGAESNAVGTASGATLFAMLMFTKGHGFVNDPIVPWARATLDEGAADDPGSRAERLARAFAAYVARVFAPLS